MFKINFRIVDDIDELKKTTVYDFNTEINFITGFFQICVGDQYVGCYYHQNPLDKDETGGELIDYWFRRLLDVIYLLETETNYVAFQEIETVNRWLEFKRIQDKVIINIVVDKPNIIRKLLIKKPYNGFSYEKQGRAEVNFSQLKKNVIDKVEEFLRDLKEINSQLLETKMANNLEKMLRNIY